MVEPRQVKKQWCAKPKKCGRGVKNNVVEESFWMLSQSNSRAQLNKRLGFPNWAMESWERATRQE